jgi:hypothetical protein
MKHKEYRKIHRLGAEETDGILIGECYIQEKIDGANASIWWDQDTNQVHYGSRTRDLRAANDNFNGFGDWVAKNPQIGDYLSKNQFIRLNGEWLVRHSIGYHEASYKQFYLYDVDEEVEGEERRLSIDHMYGYAEILKIPSAKLFAALIDPTPEQIKEYAGLSVLGAKGEGVVIKNLKFINKFGDLEYAKYVTQEFKEDNAITFGGNNKHSDTYFEMYFVNAYVTMPRLEKILHKFAAMSDERLDMKHIPQIMGMMHHDIISEEAWDISKKCTAPFDFKAFGRLVQRKTRQMYINHLNGDVSVADL